MFGVSASLMSQLGSCFIFHIAVYYQCFQFVFLCVTLEIESVGCRLLRKTRNRKENRIHTAKGHCVTNVLCSFLWVILCAGFLSFQSVTKWMNNEVQNEVYVWSVFWWMSWIFGVDDSLMSQLGRVTPDTRCLQAEQFPNTSLMFFTRSQRATIDKLLWSYNCESICSVHIDMLYWYIYRYMCNGCCSGTQYWRVGVVLDFPRSPSLYASRDASHYDLQHKLLMLFVCEL